MILSIALIVKNEEDNLARCLSSVLPLLSEIVVLDTGSNDSTVDIAKQYTQNVYHQSWVDDYALHRNHVFKKCRGDWILSIDADEELIFDGKIEPRSLLTFLDQLPIEINSCVLKLRDWRESHKTYVSEFDPVRITRNGHAKWHRRIHEEISFKGDTAYYKPLFIKHHGYNPDSRERIAKTENTIRLLEISLEENPEDDLCLFYLASAHNFLNHHRETLQYAELYYKACTQINADRIEHSERFNASIFHIAASRLIDLGKFEEAKMWIDRGMAYHQEHPDVCWDLMELGIKSKNTDIMGIGAQFYVNAFKKFKQNRTTIFANQFFSNVLPKHYVMALHNVSMGHLGAAFAQFEEIRRLAPHCDPKIVEHIVNQRANAVKAQIELYEKAHGHNINSISRPNIVIPNGVRLN